MTLSVKGHPSNYGAGLLHPCCDYSHLVDVEISQSGQTRRLLWIALSLLSGFFLAELVAGLCAGSLSLLADAGHMFSDVIGLGLTLIATWLSQRPADGRATFGHRRVEILAALVNGLSLLTSATLIAWEAVHRFQSPEPVSGLPMLIVAGVGLVINVINIALLHQSSRNDLNLRGALLHVIADTASSIGVIFAALAVYYLNWAWVDAAVSLLIACIVSCSAIPLVRQSLEILLEYAPRTVNPAKVEVALNSFAAVESVEKLHIWTITSGQLALCAHVIVDLRSGEQRDRLLRQLQTYLKQEFGISESTLQLTSRNSTVAMPITATTLHPLLNRNLVSIFSEKQEGCDCER